jgi:peptidoglycan/xylan/chitin deacetylase (PgdA/CDA1 family)
VALSEIVIKALLSMTPGKICNKLSGEFTPIFMLHRIVNNYGDVDKNQIQLLHNYLSYIRKHNYQPISISDLFKSIKNDQRLPLNRVVFTADDGFADQLEILGKVFSEYDVPLTCFVITDFLDGKLWPWDDQVKYVLSSTNLKSFSLKLPNNEPFYCDFTVDKPQKIKDCLRSRLKGQNQSNIYNWLQTMYLTAEVDNPAKAPEIYKPASWSQANAFIKSGHAIAPHTKTHRILSQLSDEESKDEIIGSYQYLKTRVPGCIDIFAYPTGRSTDFGEREQRIIRNSEMSGAVTTIPDAVRPGYRIEALPRYSIPGKMKDFLQCLSFIEVLKNKVRNIGP